MAFDPVLADRVRQLLASADGVVEKRMFGGLAFLVHGNMGVGVHGADLIVRLDPLDGEAALRQRGVRVFDLTGRPMKGWVMVAASALGSRAALEAWVGRGVAHARTLPAKAAGGAR